MFRFVSVRPFTSLAMASELVDQSEVLIGAQNMCPHPSGAYTGEISAEMLRDLYVSFVILGHSERRQFYGETNESVNKKVLAAVENNLKPIYCIGETLEEREAGQNPRRCPVTGSGGFGEFSSQCNR